MRPLPNLGVVFVILVSGRKDKKMERTRATKSAVAALAERMLTIRATGELIDARLRNEQYEDMLARRVGDMAVAPNTEFPPIE